MWDIFHSSFRELKRVPHNNLSEFIGYWMVYIMLLAKNLRMIMRDCVIMVQKSLSFLSPRKSCYFWWIAPYKRLMKFKKSIHACSLCTCYFHLEAEEGDNRWDYERADPSLTVRTVEVFSCFSILRRYIIIQECIKEHLQGLTDRAQNAILIIDFQKDFDSVNKEKISD